MQWMHNYKIKNSNYNNSLKDLMKWYNIPIPYEWKNVNKMSIFD